MNKKIVFAIVTLISLSLHAQIPDATFLWNNQEYGLSFEDTSLTPTIKLAIKKDIEGIFARIPSNTGFYSITNSTKYTGGLNLLDRELHFPRSKSGFRFGIFFEVNGVKVFQLPQNVSEDYIQAVTITNQYVTGVNALPAFLARLNTLTPATITTNEYCQLFWNHKEQRILTVPEFKKNEIEDGFIDSETYQFLIPSILAFQTIDFLGQHYLYYSMVVRNKHDDSDQKTLTLIYANNAWRFFDANDY